MSDATAPERYRYRDPMMDALLEEGPAYCVRCGNAALEGEELKAHIATCRLQLPVVQPEDGLPTIRRPSDVAVTTLGHRRPLWRRIVRFLRVLFDRKFRRCETCPSFHRKPMALFADHPADLWIAERDGNVTMIPHREIRQWNGTVHGPLAAVGWCSQHERGVFPHGVCERWRP